MKQVGLSIGIHDGYIVARPTGKLPSRLHILLVNLLGFEFNEEEKTYKVPQSPKSVAEIREMREVASRLQVTVDEDETVASLLKAWDESQGIQLASRARGTEAKASPPGASVAVPEFTRKLKPYQEGAVRHMIAVQNAANFSVPGAGKTVVALAAFAALRTEQQVEMLIVICPFSAFMSWEAEVQQSFRQPLIIRRVRGNKTERNRIYQRNAGVDVLLVTYQTAANDSQKLLDLMLSRSCMLVLDESHYIKRLEGGKWASEILNVGPYAKRRVILSGTPVPNGLEDLWSQLTFLWPSPPVLGTREQFKQALGDKSDRAAQHVTELIGPFIWRTKKADLQLPAPRFHREPVPMAKYQSAIYAVLSAKVLSDLVKSPHERERLRLWRNARMTRLLQASTNPALLAQYSSEFKIPPLDAAGLSIETIIERYSEFETPPKVTFAIELARSLIGKGQKVLIWTSFIHNLLTLQKALRTHEPRVVYGDVPRDSTEDDEVITRERMIHDFKTKDRFPLLIANPAACAESVSLHKVCKHAIYLDCTFNGAHYMQSLDRIHRLGLGPRDTVHYWLPIAKDTIDEVIDARLEEKQARMLRLLGDDLPQLSLESPQGVFTEPEDEEEDFAAVVDHIKSKIGGLE